MTIQTLKNLVDILKGEKNGELRFLIILKVLKKLVVWQKFTLINQKNRCESQIKIASKKFIK